MTITWDDLGIRRAMDGLGALKADLKAEVMTPVAVALESSTIERFDTGLAPDGEAWKPSYRATLDGGKTLVISGSYRDSFHGDAEDDAVEVGSADIRAPILNFGGTITAKGGGGLSFMLADGQHRIVQSVFIPARPVVGLSDLDRLAVVDIAEGGLRRAVGGTA